jgi:hypothetical protein
MKKGAPQQDRIRRILLNTEVNDRGCWLWTSRLFSNGYGNMGVRENGRCKNKLVHKVTWERFNGPVPGGKELDHFVCDTKRCCNPFHVRPVTHLENLKRRTDKITACPHGHSNYAARPDNGRRRCRTCDANRERAKRLAAKELLR